MATTNTKNRRDYYSGRAPRLRANSGPLFSVGLEGRQPSMSAANALNRPIEIGMPGGHAACPIFVGRQSVTWNVKAIGVKAI